jgi:thiol-disulfide isomerase/thioredoxin
MTTITKYCTDPNVGYDGFVDDKSVLDSDDDAAYAIYGGKWRMPTKEEQDELRDKCSWQWKQVNGKNGYEVTGPNGNSIFLPAAGSRTDTFLHDANTTGTYWSSSLCGSHSAYFISFESDGVYGGGSVRCAGRPIRSVYGDVSTTPDIFELSPTEVTVDGDGGEITVDVTASTGYRITSMPDWITELTVGEDTHSHRFKVAANESWQSRSGIIVFSNQKAVNRTVTVRQDGMNAKLVVSPAELSVGGAGGTRSVDVTSNVGWIAVSDRNWCTLAPEEGVGDRTLRIEVSENPDLTPRSATINISATDGTLSRTVLVNQAGNEAISFDWDREFYHRSLILEFSATWCGYCSTMDHSLAATHEKYPDRFVSVNLQGNGSNLEFDEHGPLSALFDVTGYPSSYMDFRRKIGNYEADYYSSLFNRYLEEQEENYPAVTTVALESSLSGSNLDVDVTLYVKEAGDYKVAVYLTESGIVGFQADHTDGDRYDYQHNDVVRLSLTDVLGDAISVTSANTRLKRSYSVSIPSGYDRNRLKLLVYVQRAYGSKPRMQDGSFGDYYVDNSVYAEVGRSVPPAVVAGSGGGNEDVTDGKPVNW